MKRLAGDELHHDEGPAALLANVVNRDDVRMIERGSQPSLTRQPLGRGRVGSEFIRDKLDGDQAAQASVARLIDLSHAPGSKGADDFIGADTVPSLQHGGGRRIHRFMGPARPPSGRWTRPPPPRGSRAQGTQTT